MKYVLRTRFGAQYAIISQRSGPCEELTATSYR
jgi:hypothetical protein